MTESPDAELEFDNESTDADDDARRYKSLETALRDKGIPLENHALIRKFTSSIGIAEFHGRSDYIKAVRVGDGPDLQIHYGWSIGFASEAEVDQVAGPSTDRWPSRNSPGQWGVDHPVHGSWGGGGKTGNPKRDYGICPRCQQYALLPNGGCSGGCDE